MASLRVLAFDHEGRPVQFDTWLDDLQLYLLSDSKDSVSLFDLTSGAAPAPPATADSGTRSQWLTRNAAARLAIRNHLPLAECAHFGQHRTAQALYAAVVARYSLHATAALSFATIEDLVSHVRTSDARYRATDPAEFLDRNQPPMFITLYFIVIRLPDSLRSVRDHFLSHDPTSLTVDLLEQHLLAGVLPLPPALFYASAAAADVSVAEDVGAASASVKRRSSKGKGGKGGGGGSGSSGGGSSGGGGGGGTGGGSGGFGSGRGGSSGSGGSGDSDTGGGGTSARRVGSGGGQPHCPYVIRTGVRGGQTCGKLHTQHRCFSCLDDAWRAEFGDDVELPRWADLLCKAAAALGASESGTLPDTAPARALHTFTLDSGASAYFFRDITTLIPLSTPVRSDWLTPLGARTAALQDVMVTTTTPGGQRVTICTCTRSGRHLATFTRRRGWSLYTLATKPPQVAASAHVSASGKVVASCSCRLLSHQTLLEHHRLGHPSLPRLRGMHSRLLVSGLPRSLPPLPPSPAPPCLPCVAGLHRVAPHSSFTPTTAHLQTLHMDVWGPACVSGQSRERYFLLVVDDYTRYTTVFPLRSKGQVIDVLIPWIRAVRLQLRERFGQDLPVLRLHSDRGGEFSSNLLRDFCRGEGILQSFTLPDSPQQIGIAERRIGLVMEVAPQPLSPCLLAGDLAHTALDGGGWRCVGVPGLGISCLCSRYVRGHLSPCAIPCVFLGFVLDALGWHFYHPTSRHVFPSQDVMFDESVPFYRLFPYRSAPPPPPPLFLAPCSPPVDPLLPQGPAPSGVSQVDPLLGLAPVQVAVGSGAARGAASEGAEPGGAESEGVGSGGAKPGGEEPVGAKPVGLEPEGAEPRGAESEGAESKVLSLGVLLRLEVLLVLHHECLRSSCVSGLFGAHAFGVELPELELEVLELLLELVVLEALRLLVLEVLVLGVLELPGLDGVEGTGAGDPTEPGAAGAGGTGASGAGAGGAGTAGAGAVDPGAGGAGDTSQLPLQPTSPLPAASPYTEQSGGLIERSEPASHLVLPVCTARRIPRSCPPPVPGTHVMALHPSSVPLRVLWPAPPESSLPEVPDPESDCARAASPTVAHLLATAVTDPSFESTAASALVAELLDVAAACRLDYATALVAESESATPPSVRGECALGTDVLEDRQEDFECLAAALPRFASMLFAPEGDPDAPDIPTLRSYAEAITGPYSSQWQEAMDANTAFLQGSLHEEIWLRRPPGFIQSFPASTQWSLWRPVYGLRQAPREWHNTLRTTLAALGFAPATADPSLFVRTDTLLPPFYVLVYVDDLVFATADTEALTLVKSELQKRHTYTDLGEMRSYLGLKITRDRARRTTRSFSASASSSLPHSPLLCLPATHSQLHLWTSPHRKVHWDAAKRVLRYLCSTSGMGLVLGGWGPVVLTGHADASWVDDSATQRLSQGYTFCLGSGSVSWRSTRSSWVLSSSCEAEIYAGAMAALELRWLTHLLADLGEQPRSPPVLYVDNKAMNALCQEHRLEHRTKHIALRYFLSRELQQRGQLRLAYVSIWANTADVFTKALPPGDHQCFATVLGLVPTLPHLLTARLCL
ncbi:unnamed protein product [Closterium sp. NIES-53]